MFSSLGFGGLGLRVWDFGRGVEVEVLGFWVEGLRGLEPETSIGNRRFRV